jgi:hypothetical protein
MLVAGYARAMPQSDTPAARSSGSRFEETYGSLVGKVVGKVVGRQ